MVNKHNEEYKSGIHSWQMGINQFADGTMPSMGLLLPEPVEIVVYLANDEEWEKYKLKYNKNYTPEEEPERYLTDDLKLN